MCGISGIYGKNENTGELTAAVGKMCEAQYLRGPDDEGIFLDEKNKVALGHRRLSILDLSAAGHQPMVWRGENDEEIVVVFNGEIYNFLELKNGLRGKGYSFKTKTDTEVILALYAEYGAASFAMLRGMFAFSLWDSRGQKLFLVKDRYGIKPLYYFSDGEKLIFSSTVKSIIQSGMVPVEKNYEAYIGFLLFGSVPLPMTTVKNIFGIPAGHYLEIDVNRERAGEKKLIQYYNPLAYFQNQKEAINFNGSGRESEHIDLCARWRPHFSENGRSPFISVKEHPDPPQGAMLRHLRRGSFNSAVSEIKSLLNKSVDLHLISDAPLGIFLSGGLDSSAIAALAAKQRPDPVATLSIIFDEKEFSEQKYSRMVAQRIKSDHREIKITKKDFYDSFAEFFEAMDQPTIDGVNTFFVSKAAKDAGLKVVLSGIGSDEIFCGYESFRKAAMLRKIQKLPNILKSPLGLIAKFGDRYKKLDYLREDNVLNFYLAIRGLTAPQEIARILGADMGEINEFINNQSGILSQEMGKFSSNIPPVNLLSYLELKFYLQNQLLKDTDFMSMHHSIEVRVPFLDHLLVEYLSSVPPKIKLGKEINKPLLVESVRGSLPVEIFTRPKMGFTFPFEKWMREKENFSGHWSRWWAKEVLNKFV